MRLRLIALLPLALAAVPAAFAQNESAYIFRYQPGPSDLMLKTMTFADENPLELGACTTTEKSNGPIFCAENCEQVPVCLMVFVGPSGLATSDILEKVEETPLATASPTPGSRAHAYSTRSSSNPR